MPSAEMPERKSKTRIFRVTMKDRHTGETITRSVFEKDPDEAFYKMKKLTMEDTGMTEEAYDDTYRAMPLGVE